MVSLVREEIEDGFLPGILQVMTCGCVSLVCQALGSEPHGRSMLPRPGCGVWAGCVLGHEGICALCVPGGTILVLGDGNPTQTGLLHKGIYLLT